MAKHFVVQYIGPFGFLKPWTAVRDGETFSQQFLTPSVIEGMEKKLFPELLQIPGLQGRIVGHRVNYTGISPQQEQTWSKAWIEKREGTIVEKRTEIKKGKTIEREVKVPLVSRRPATGILMRGLLVEPHLYLAFAQREWAERAATQHLCFCRNEDVMLPQVHYEVSEDEWRSEAFPGFELLIGEQNGPRFKVGHNRFAKAAAMYGEVVSFGDPIRKRTEYL